MGKNNTFKKDFIPLFLPLILLGVSLGTSIFTNHVLEYRHYGGLFLVVLATILFFKNQKLYFYIFGCTLLISVPNLVDFFIITTRIHIGPLECNPINVTLLLVFLVRNKKQVHQLFSKIEKTKHNNAKKLAPKIQHFEQRFNHKSEMELRQIVEAKTTYVEEARIAAKRLLKEKHNK